MENLACYIVIEDEEVIKKFLKHLGFWDVNPGPPPGIRADAENPRIVEEAERIRRKEAAEIALREREITRLDSQIERTKTRIGLDTAVIADPVSLYNQVLALDSECCHFETSTRPSA